MPSSNPFFTFHIGVDGLALDNVDEARNVMLDALRKRWPRLNTPALHIITECEVTYGEEPTEIGVLRSLMGRIDDQVSLIHCICNDPDFSDADVRRQVPVHLAKMYNKGVL